MKNVACIISAAASAAILTACSVNEANAPSESGGAERSEHVVLTFTGLSLSHVAQSVVPGRFEPSAQGILVRETERTQQELGPGNAVLVDINDAVMGLVLGDPIEIVLEVEADPNSVQFFAAYYTFGAGNSGPQPMTVGRPAVLSAFLYDVPDAQTPRHAIAMWARGGSALVSSIEISQQN